MSDLIMQKLRSIIAVLRLVQQMDAKSVDLYKAGMSDGIKFALDEIERKFKEEKL